MQTRMSTPADATTSAVRIETGRLGRALGRPVGAVAAVIAAALSLLLLAAPAARAETPRPESDADRGERSGYSYVRLVTGDATVNSRWNGKVEAKRNMPISAGDEIQVSDPARVEVGLADGNVLQIGGGTRAQFASLNGQQGEDDEYSAIAVRDGSVILSALGRNEDQLPRIDTDDATIYVSAGARVRVNVDPRRGTSVVDRNGAVEVRTRTGSYKLHAGQYLIVRGEEEPEIARGSFSRDRFDLWASDRMDSIAESTRTVSARYVDEDYASDVESLDGYGDWNYSPTYSSYVWTPHVDINWMPFSIGSWYYTPAGLTWWSQDPWGWYPHHYGNWYFEASWNRWCWSPAAVYSPAWVYWAYSGNYVGWCPTGWYSGYGPWQNYRNHRAGGSYLALHGTFHPREVDFRGWNFTGAKGFGAGYGRAEVVRGDRIASQLGAVVSISSKPIVVSAKPGEAREAIRDYVREAPRVIERASTSDPSRLTPILGRQKTLPPASVEALREGTVTAERGRLAGPAAAELAPRGARIERGRAAIVESTPRGASPDGKAGAIERARPVEGGPGSTGSPVSSSRADRERGRMDGPAVPSVSSSSRERSIERAAPADRAAESWRSRGRAPETSATGSTTGTAAQTTNSSGSTGGATRGFERGEGEPSATDSRGRRQDWRTKEVPPARRVIDGSVPGRREIRSPDPRAPETRSPEPRYRASETKPETKSLEAPRHEAPPARVEAPPPAPRHSEVAHPESRPAPPAPRVESHPAPQAPDSHSDRNRKD